VTASPTPIPRLLLTVADVSAATGYSKAFIYELIASGTLPSLRLGRSVRVPSDGLTRWIEDQIEEGE
jgi:excisionase family DNA binding protein